MLSKGTLRLSIAVVVGTATLALASPSYAAVIDTGGCTTSAVVNASSTSCSFTLACPEGCSFSARVGVNGVGLTGGRITATASGDRCTVLFFNEPCSVLTGTPPPPNPAPRSASCQHLLACEAAVGGSFTNPTRTTEGFTVTRRLAIVRIDCVETGPSLLESAACTAQTVK